MEAMIGKQILLMSNAMKDKFLVLLEYFFSVLYAAFHPQLYELLLGVSLFLVLSLLCRLHVWSSDASGL